MNSARGPWARLVAGGLVMGAACAAQGATLLYYNDGSGAPGGETLAPGVFVEAQELFGAYTVGQAFQDDPLLAGAGVVNPNTSFVFHHDVANGLAGGGIYLRIGLPAGVTRGAIVGGVGPNPPGAPNPPDPPAGPGIVNYGTVAQANTKPGSQWQANFAFAAQGFTDGPVDRRWVDLVTKANKGEIRLVNQKYVNDPNAPGAIFTSPPPAADPAPGDLQNQLQGADGMIFFDVEGGEIDFIDLYIGDFLQEIAWETLNHHLTYFALFGDAAPADFGLAPADTNLFTFTRTGNVGQDGRFGVHAVVAYSDPPPVPVPGALSLLLSGLATLGLMGGARRRRG